MPDSSAIRDLLHTSYNRDTWEPLLVSLFPAGALTIFQEPQPLAATHEKVTDTLQLGTLTLPGDDQTIAILEVTTTDQVQLARNRVGLRNYVASFIDQAQASGVLAVFRQPHSPDWRLTYASRTTTLDQDTFQITTIETAPKRYTFLLGENEPCRTAAARLVQLGEKSDDLTLKDIELAFSVESLTKTFFRKYKEQYETFIAHLLSDDLAEETRELFGIDPCDHEAEQDKADKPVRDFVKTLLGRLVFLTFLQKKGWLGCSPDHKEWINGDPNFLQSYLQLAKENDEASSFLSKYLNELFFNALNNDERKKTNNLFPITQTRVPFLNGGLFEDDNSKSHAIDFPAQLFTDLLNFFDEYNFTIDENDPEDHEVGIDPEMLGMIFENLLEDNKEKGTYYTPKAIVSYMARQSLLHYLETHLGKEEELTLLLNEKDPANHPKGSFVHSHAKDIATLLQKVKICDPAIGSGAFPIGLLHEILWTRLTLNWELNTPEERAKLKRQIIQKSIHGVDLDPGAVEIARLRFWLALVVDEDQPNPLPNLDYKIIQGNSLLESFEGVDLSQILDDQSDQTHKLTTLVSDQSEFDLASDAQQELRTQAAEKQSELLEARRAYFAARKPERKLELRAIIDQKIIEHIDHHIRYQLDCEEIQQHRTETEWAAKREKAPKWNPPKAAENRYQKLLAHIDTLKASLGRLADLQHSADRPFFLWHLLFQDVFADGGFDIIIANPPYVRHELIKDQKPFLQAEGYHCYSGTADLFVYFYEQAHNLLKDKGTLTFITSNKFYRAGYGEKLRQFLAEKQSIHTLVDFRDAPVFNNVIAYASIYIGQKQAPHAGQQVQALPWDLTKPAATLPQEIKTAFNIFQSNLTADGWNLSSPKNVSLLKKIRNTGTNLASFTENGIYAGIKTGLNSAFVFKKEDCPTLWNCKESPIKLFIRGKNISRWSVEKPSEKLIYTPHGFLIEESPKTFLHLQPFKIKLEQRALDQKWFELQQPQQAYEATYKKKKIVFPDIAPKPSFAIDGGYYPDMTAFCLDTEEYWILPILNSLLTDYIFRVISPQIRGGYLRFKTQYVKQLPIPPATDAEKAELATLAEKCAAAAAKDDQATLAVHEAEINQIVYRLFDLTPEEITLIESSLET